MKSHIIPSYKTGKANIVKKYPAIKAAIDGLESKILENPAGGIKEILVIKNRHVTTRKRGIKTNLFSDRLPDHYLYITVNYGLADNGDIVFLTIYLHDYII